MDEEEENQEQPQNTIGNQIKEAGKQEVKKGAKQIIKKLLIKAMPLIAVLLIGLMVASVFMSLTNIIKETAQGIINSILDFFKGSQTYIEIDDEKLDELIKLIEATGIDLEDLELLRQN